MAEFTMLDQIVHLEGELNEAKIEHLKAKGILSLMFLCKDKTESCFPAGFDALSSHFPSGAAVHVPLDPTRPEFQPEGHYEFPWQPILAYKKFEEALDRLPLPTAITCKSSRRASAVYAAYKAVSQRMSAAELHRFSQTQDLLYLGSAGLYHWVDAVVNTLARPKSLIFRQLFESASSTFTYLLADDITKEAVLIDPVLETVARDVQLLKDLGLTLKYALNTHCHADHVTGTHELRKHFPEYKSVIAETAGTRADILLKDLGHVSFGQYKLYGMRTPGHTDGCMSFVLDDLSRVFTGDALLIRGCGRTDFQAGSADRLYHSVHDRLFSWLPESCAVYPAHDYKGNTQSSIAEEKRLNPRLTKSKEEFINIMANLNLAKPAKIDIAVPANLVDGDLPPAAPVAAAAEHK